MESMHRSTGKQRPSITQKEFLISYMEEHLHFARHEIAKLGSRSHDKYWQMWGDLSVKLNEIGPSIKGPKSWEKMWIDLRLAAKRRRADYMKELRTTGNVPPKYPLYDCDERMCKIFGPYCIGIPIIAEVGLPNSYWADTVTEITKNNHTPTADQKHHLLSFMADNKFFAQKKYDASTMNLNWLKLTAELNTIDGGTVCSNKTWIKIWDLMVERALTYKKICKSNKQPLDDQNQINILTIIDSMN